MRIGYTKDGLVFMVGETRAPDGHLTQAFMQWLPNDALTIARELTNAAKEARKTGAIIVEPERRVVQ
jgi:hypothetical protein